MIFRRALDVPSKSDYREYRDAYLRPDFHYRCAYCLIKEGLFLEEGGGEIDHHRPLNPPSETGKSFVHLKNVYANLYWTCGRCNSEKGNTWPTDEEYQTGVRFLDPCAEDHRDHWGIRTDGTLEPRTSIGQYTIDEIRLNRRFLVRMRRQFLEKRRRVAQAEQQIAISDLTPEEKAEIIGLLKNDFLLHPPAFGE